MKLTSRILLVVFLAMVVGVLSSNLVLKKQYDAIDKSDIYWTYDRILEKPFRHIKIIGGNVTTIIYENNARPSVRLSHDWVKFHGGRISNKVENDTLFINFDFQPADRYEKFWTKHAVTVRIFSPELLSVTGVDTKLIMEKFVQKSISINLSGKSKLEVENVYSEMDSIRIYQTDSTAVSFERSPDYRKDSLSGNENVLILNSKDGGVINLNSSRQKNEFNESITIKSVNATLKGYSILDIGRAQVQHLQLNISDSSAIVLSGGALRKSDRNFTSVKTD